MARQVFAIFSRDSRAVTPRFSISVSRTICHMGLPSRREAARISCMASRFMGQSSFS